jgi:hypothetical protein
MVNNRYNPKNLFDIFGSLFFDEMKFRSRNQEGNIRALLAVIIVLFLIMYKDNKLLITDIFPSKTLRGIILVILIMTVGWLTFGKLITPRKEKK